MERYWVWEYGLFEKNPKRVDSLNPETTLEVVKLADVQATVAALQCELLKWKRALCNLTPGGSEFADDHAYCAEWVRKARENQHDIIISKHREMKAAQAALQRAKAEGRQEVIDLFAKHKDECGDFRHCECAGGLIYDLFSKPIEDARAAQIEEGE